MPEKIKRKLLDAKTWERDGKLFETASALRHELGEDVFEDHNVFREQVDAVLRSRGIKPGAADKKFMLRAVSRRVETAPPVVAKLYNPDKMTADPLRGRYEIEEDGKRSVAEYEPDTDLRDTEQVPLSEQGGIEAFIRREVLPYTPDAWIDAGKTQIGYEISFTRHFYKPVPLRSMDEIRADILALEQETEGLLSEIVGAAKG